MPISFSSRYNLDAIEEEYRRWRGDPLAVDEIWRAFFEGFELGQGEAQGQPSLGLGRQPSLGFKAQTGICRLIDAYRGLGHIYANLDPLSDPPKLRLADDLSEYDLTDADLDAAFDTSYFRGLAQGTLRELIAALEQTYCGTVGVEYMHIQDSQLRQWLEQQMEPSRNRPHFPPPIKQRILADLHHAESFERFLHTRYLGQKRFSLEGGETLIPLLNMIVETGAATGVKEIVLGMAHRGRLNVLANILGQPYKEIFALFDAHYIPNSFGGDGDVKYHLGYSDDRLTSTGHPIHLTLTPNPSHLEVVDPVVEGRTRAKQRDWEDTRPAARFTSSSTTRSASPRAPPTPAPRAMRPTWPRWWKRRSFT
jgi:2-oxoglutarate dehydrogenase E1 component